MCLVQKGLFSDEFLKLSRRPLRLKVANAKTLDGEPMNATIGLEYWEHDRLNWPHLAERSVLSGSFYAADISDLDIIMGYHFDVPLERFLTVERWFERTRSVLLGYLRTIPQDYLSGPEMRRKESRRRSRP